MAHFTQPGYFPGGYMQTPSQPPFQNLPGFPRGFPASRYVQQPVHAPPLAQVTPDMINFPLQHEGHDLWPPAPTDSEATESESESDSDDSTVLANTPLHLPQAYYSDRNPPRGRSNSRSAARYRGKGASHFFPKEQSRGRSAPPPMIPTNGWNHPQHQPGLTPFYAPHGLPPEAQLHANTPLHATAPLHANTPLNVNAPLPFAPQTQPFFHHQQQMPAGYHPGAPYGGPTGYPPQMKPIYTRPIQDFSQMPPAQYPPVHSTGSGIHRSVPQPGVIPIQRAKSKRKWSRSKSKDRSSRYGVLPNAEWGKEAARHAVIDPARLSGKDLKRIQLHPLLAPGCRELMLFNVIRPPATLTASGHYSIKDYLADPATCPPVNSLTFWTGVHEQAITIQSPAGVTVENVLGFIGEMMFGKLRHATWNAFSEERRAEITDFFHHNRMVGLMPPVEKGIRFADLLGENTIFCGMELCQRQPHGQTLPPGTFVIRWGSR